MKPIRIWNRAAGREETEAVYGSEWLERGYGTKTGRWLTDRFLTKPWISSAVGIWQNLPPSRSAIAPFIEKYNVPMEEFEPAHYRSFNDFFIRRFRPEARTFSSNPRLFPAFAEGRYLAFASAGESQRFQLKGSHVNMRELLGEEGSEFASRLQDGPLLIARLCPVDYHRFHFPDAGRELLEYTKNGPLHSVNPVALDLVPGLLMRNERHISILETENFGLLAYVEVGALCVGRIVQSHRGGHFQRGEEKGYFLFGGSSIVLAGEKGRWTPEKDILQRTAEGMECLVHLGETIGTVVG